MHNEILPPDSAFSRAVYTEIRPAIPRANWPGGALRATFVPAPDGLSLIASFEGLPPAAAAVAAQVVRQAKVDLVLASPVAYFAAAVVKARRWRDVFLYALLPCLFAIPLMAPLGSTFMHLCFLLFALNTAGLIGTHAVLLQRRAAMTAGRFMAMIPVPGLRLRVPVGTPVHHRE